MDASRVQVDAFYLVHYRARHPEHPGVVVEGSTVNEACRALATATGDEYEVGAGRGDTPESARVAMLQAALVEAQAEVANGG